MVILESPVFFNTSGKRIAFMRVGYLLVEIGVPSASRTMRLTQQFGEGAYRAI